MVIVLEEKSLFWYQNNCKEVSNSDLIFIFIKVGNFYFDILQKVVLKLSSDNFYSKKGRLILCSYLKKVVLKLVSNIPEIKKSILIFNMFNPKIPEN